MVVPIPPKTPAEIADDEKRRAAEAQKAQDARIAREVDLDTAWAGVAAAVRQGGLVIIVEDPDEED